jgi:hypothetical protein
MLWASRKKAIAKTTKNRNLPIWNQDDLRPGGAALFEFVVI